ncbi:MAG: hypothetical protein A3C93_00225 [Candidatus Lloydbacteria bacterium RIFCSPHIGHO2_02_FULL_54_17]|uniref:Uncharacterized protein n=1 Tax=Candidatus Lloydbacteria bacterium RIFCSPHIGHO2_02_FULL_54_17 TaxID=1798664 RepID=A0A1G2DIA1_9BACT|nr:MAG: hypothetical protein A2762_03975 [Candidatus Lloydbacteria bacterium RIFCSPHIGHO2_01_FULL_54_11]OGZ13329.1 MAG: hypothetical protein A3C93_00225 [Candidatus Lloydbacteria bacterium RIFCSPHIGHO2_02_FULL_54_17]OGZ17137.1 MAG: hypothetical protein A3H76_03025 [Candidatus Lloydbacteria bacterium RIFCSPLOWO2_02_FULL_54_12]
MSDPVQDSPQKALIHGMVAGLVFGLLFAYFQGPKVIAEVPAVTVIVGNLAFAAIFAFAYFFFFRTSVANVKGDPKGRTKFAEIYFLWIGMIVAMESVRFFFGASLVDTASTVLSVVVGLSVSYRKLCQIYRAGGEGGGGNTPQPPSS